jgi:hypothetical protein
VRSILIPAVLCLVTTALHAADLVVRLPDGMKATSAVAINEDDRSQTRGRVADDGAIRFTGLAAGVPINVNVTLEGGTVLQGVNLTWSDDEPGDPDAKPLESADLREINQLLTEVRSFYNISEILFLEGNQQRAVGLVRLIRDQAFYADKGGEYIWRIEIYYFKKQYGGWEKVQQANKVLHRERFRSKDAHDQATGRLKFVPQLGGLRLNEDAPTEVTVPENAGEPTFKVPDDEDEEDD